MNMMQPSNAIMQWATTAGIPFPGKGGKRTRRTRKTRKVKHTRKTSKTHRRKSLRRKTHRRR